MELAGTDGCNKLTVFRFGFRNMSLPNGEKPFDGVKSDLKIVEKEFF